MVDRRPTTGATRDKMPTSDEQSILTSIAANVIRLRVERELTQSALARLVEWQDRTIQILETGKGNPSVKLLIAVAQALEVPVTELFTPAKIPSKLSSRRAHSKPALRPPAPADTPKKRRS